MRRRLVITALIAALSASGCMTVSKNPDNCGPHPTDEQVAAAVQAYIAGQNWKDPDSVHTRNIELKSCAGVWKGLINGGGYLTGWEIDFEVNAKNSYGGYTGFELRSIILTSDGQVHWTTQ